MEWLVASHWNRVGHGETHRRHLPMRPSTNVFSSNFNLSKQELCGFVDNIHWICSGPSRTSKLTIPETLNGQRTQPTNIKVGGGEREREKWTILWCPQCPRCPHQPRGCPSSSGLYFCFSQSGKSFLKHRTNLTAAVKLCSCRTAQEMGFQCSGIRSLKCSAVRRCIPW